MAPTEAAAPPPLPPFDPVAAAGAQLQEAEAAAAAKTDPATEMGMATSDPSDAPAATAAARPPQRRKRRPPSLEPQDPPPTGLPFDPADYPELTFDAAADHSRLVHAFREPLFKDSTVALEIAYSHRDAAAAARDRVRRRKRAAVRELKELREEFHAKKAEVVEINAQLKEGSRQVGNWNRKVFDLELDEPNCGWNEKYRKLKDYVDAHGSIPEHAKKAKGTDEERTLAAFVATMRAKVRKGHASVLKCPHRMEALEALGVKWEGEHDARFEAMFAKLLAYRREHGTFRLPSIDLCKESGDADLIALHNWVFSQVGSFRYQLKSKKVEVVQRFLDVGFSFERWYATAGHVYDRDIPPFDAICRRYVENGGTILESDLATLREASEKKSGSKTKKRKYKKRKKKGEEGGGEAPTPAEEGNAAAEAGEGAEGESKGKVDEEGAAGEAEEQDGAAAPMEGVEAAADDVQTPAGAPEPPKETAAPTGMEETAIDAGVEAAVEAAGESAAMEEEV